VNQPELTIGQMVTAFTEKTEIIPGIKYTEGYNKLEYGEFGRPHQYVPVGVGVRVNKLQSAPDMRVRRINIATPPTHTRGEKCRNLYDRLSYEKLPHEVMFNSDPDEEQQPLSRTEMVKGVWGRAIDSRQDPRETLFSSIFSASKGKRRNLTGRLAHQWSPDEDRYRKRQRNEYGRYRTVQRPFAEISRKIGPPGDETVIVYPPASQMVVKELPTISSQLRQVKHRIPIPESNKVELRYPAVNRKVTSLVLNNSSESHAKKEKEKKKRPVCKVCGKFYATTGTLNRHMRIHTGKRPYMCGRCHKTFRQRAHLITHFVVHDKARNHYCEYCGNYFARKNSLVSHKRTQHGIHTINPRRKTGGARVSSERQDSNQILYSTSNQQTTKIQTHHSKQIPIGSVPRSVGSQLDSKIQCPKLSNLAQRVSNVMAC